MRVRIRSGNRAGTTVELPQTEAEIALATGYAERVEASSEPAIITETRTPDAAPVADVVPLSAPPEHPAE